MLPTEQKALDLWRNPTALSFIDYWQLQVDRDRLRDLGKFLGVIWERDEVEAVNEQEISRKKWTAPNELFMPLATIIEPTLTEHVKKMFGRKLGIDAPQWARRDEFVDLYEETDQEGFLNFIQQFIRPKVVGKL